MHTNVFVSIRSPHRSKGRPHRGRTASHLRPVSIRSPHRSKGRRWVSASGRTLTGFQSAPLTEARGDKEPPTLVPVLVGFNPLPSPKQGETTELNAIPRNVESFQSAPLTEARGDSRSFSIALHSCRFQSAPLTEARGDLPLGLDQINPLQFQSAPLTEARGDSRGLPSSSVSSSFQSAPLTEARGDERNGKNVGGRPNGFNPLPSPKQGETCPKGEKETGFGQFQSAPLTEARGDGFVAAVTGG